MGYSSIRRVGSISINIKLLLVIENRAGYLRGLLRRYLIPSSDFPYPVIRKREYRAARVSAVIEYACKNPSLKSNLKNARAIAFAQSCIRSMLVRVLEEIQREGAYSRSSSSVAFAFLHRIARHTRKTHNLFVHFSRACALTTQ